MKWPNVLSSLVEDDAPKVKPISPHEQAPASALAPVASTVTEYVGPLSVERSLPNDSAYQGLLAKTDIAVHPVFQTINKHLAPIAALAIDEKMKFAIAFKQAQTLDGIQASSVVDVFTQMKSVLQGEADKFSQTIVKATADKVEGPKARAVDLSNQISKLQAEVAQLTEESFNAQQKIQTAQHRFDVALSTRQGELAHEQAKYASLLGEQ